MAKRWYVIQAHSGYEKRVKTQLEERIKLHGLEDLFGQILVPTEEVVEMKAGQKRKSERKYFPGYVLIEMEMNEDQSILCCIEAQMMNSTDIGKVEGYL